MSEEFNLPNTEEMVLCPACTAEFASGNICPNCGAEVSSEEEEESESGEPASIDGFPETTFVPPIPDIKLTDGFNLNIDPTTLSQEQLTITVSNIRKLVIENKPVADATIAYGIKCIAIMRQSRPAKEPSARARPVMKTMNLDDF